MRLATTTALLALFALPACEEETEIRQAEFASRADCLAAIEQRARGPLEIDTDRAELVVGYYPDGRQFTCEQVTSEDKGTYFIGSFESR